MNDLPTEQTTGVFIVDDHPSYRAAAAAVVDAADGFEVVGSSGSVCGAIESVLAMVPPPNLILLDVNLGDGSGLEVATALVEARADIKIVFISALARDELPPGAAASGAAGYLPKLELSPTTLEHAWAGAYDWRP